MAEKAGREREILRPAIDRAAVVIGLEDMGVSGRRKMADDIGSCWFCGTKGFCEFCGTETTLLHNGVGKGVSPAPKRVGSIETGQNSLSNKRLKIKKVESMEQTLTSVYPNPLNDTTWPAPCPQMYYDPTGSFPYPQQSHSTSKLEKSDREALSSRAVVAAYHYGNLQADHSAAIIDQAMVKDFNIHPQQSLHSLGPGSGSGSGSDAEACFNSVGLHDQVS